MTRAVSSDGYHYMVMVVVIGVIYATRSELAPSFQGRSNDLLCCQAEVT